MVKCTGRGLVVKQPGVLSKVQMLNLVLGVGVCSLLPTFSIGKRTCPNPSQLHKYGDTPRGHICNDMLLGSTMDRKRAIP